MDIHYVTCQENVEAMSLHPEGSAAAPLSSERRLAGVALKWWVLVSVGIATFMTALDSSVVNAVLPIITRDFRSDMLITSWVVTVFLLVLSGLLLTFGRLGDLYGHKRVFVIGFVIFVIGSAACSFAPSVWALIVSRAFQAVGSAILASNAPAILTTTFPPQQRGQALGMQATMTYLGLTLGPSLGGFLTALFGWRSVFFINIPIGLFALLIATRVIPAGRVTDHAERFDPLGAGVFMIGLVTLLFGLNRGRDWGWLSPRTLGCIIAALILLALFVHIERRVPYPMLDLGLFRSRTFTVATASAIIVYICLYSVSILMPFYLIQARGMSPDHAGLILSAQAVVMAVLSPLTGTLSDKIGSFWLTSAGLTVLALSMALISLLGPQTPLTRVPLLLGILGVGMGLFTTPNNNALMGSAPRHRQGVAGGIMASARNVGMVLGIGFSSAIFSTVELQAQRAGDPLAFYRGFHVTFLVMAGTALVGLLVSTRRRWNG
jgi:EmrB/QacA subfamily drug resistance transporter